MEINIKGEDKLRSALIKAIGPNQKEIAEKASWHKTDLSAFKNGNKKFGLRALLRLQDALGVKCLEI